MGGSGLSGRRTLVGVAVGTALVAAGGTYALAAPGPVVITGAGVSSGGPCKIGYDTSSATLTPPDELLADNPVAGSVTLRKGCAGAVVGEFSSEVRTATGVVTLSMWATCVGTGGFEDACTVGDQVVARPGYTYLAEGDSSEPTTSVHSMQMVFPALPRGRWRFDAVPGGGNATLHARTFVVTAYPGG
jgi:hypothetical protein